MSGRLSTAGRVVPDRLLLLLARVCVLQPSGADEDPGSKSAYDDGMGVGFLIKVEKSSRSMSLRILIFGEMRACPLGG